MTLLLDVYFFREFETIKASLVDFWLFSRIELGKRINELIAKILTTVTDLRPHQSELFAPYLAILTNLRPKGVNL